MSARLILSFDCEGKWGISDLGRERQRSLTTVALNLAYTTILNTLRKFGASATFAFVSALCLPKDWAEAEIEKNHDRMMYGQKHWLTAALESVRSGEFEGWSEPGLISLVRHEACHHICSHGGFHIPYDSSNTPPEAIDADLNLVRSIDPIVGSKQTVFVFPRNIIGYRSKARKAGIIAYRDADPRELSRGTLGRLQRLMLEFIPLDRGDAKRHSYGTAEGMTALSPGKFLNASIGMRSRIPMSLTKRRIDIFLAHAVRNDSVVHFYSHPHNFINDKTLNQKLEYLLMRASDFRNRGALKIITMKDEIDGRQ